MADNTIKSLERIDNAGVMQVWETFAEKKQRFTDIGLEIRGIHNAIKGAWNGEACNEYRDQFDNIFSQVEDIGDALTQIADALKEVVYDSFYVADDSLNQQLLEAQHNQQKGSNDSGGGKADYKQLKPKPVLYSTIKDAYVPNLAYPKLPARPVLVSTIGKAYQPNLAYQTMQPKPVLSSCIPSARMVNLTYRNLTQRAVLSSVIGDAVQANISYIELARRAQLSSTIGEMKVPDLSFVPMALRPMETSALGQMLQFLLDYSAAAPGLQQVKNTLMATQINQIVIDSLAQGRTDAETAALIGEAVISNIHGELDPALRQTLVSVIGDGVFQYMYGRAPGEASSGTPINWIDTGMEKNTLGLVRDAVGMAAQPVTNPIQLSIGNMPTGDGARCVLTVQTGVGAVNSTAGIISAGIDIGTVPSQKVVAVMSDLAAAGNQRSLEVCVCRIAAEQTGAASVIAVSATSQAVSGTTIVINAGTPAVTPETTSALVAGSMDAAASANISNVVTQWSAGAGQFDFSTLQFPCTADSLASVV